MKQKRPVNLDLSSLTYPPMAIVSILHRISGLILFLLFPYILYLLHLSLVSEASFIELHQFLAAPVHLFFLWAFASALIFHLLAGIRHILMDVGLGEGLAAGRMSAIFVIAAAALLIVLLGIWLW